MRGAGLRSAVRRHLTSAAAKQQYNSSVPKKSEEALLMKILINTCAAFCVASATQVHAQDYPRGPINLVIPLAPGDATDTSARAIADALSRELKVAIVPVNRPGAGGALGTGQVVKSKPDGYTIVLTNNASLVFRSILDPKTASYNPLTDLTPLGLGIE